MKECKKHRWEHNSVYGMCIYCGADYWLTEGTWRWYIDDTKESYERRNNLNK
jgi:hypothetical protein